MKWHRGSPTTPGWYWYRPQHWEWRNGEGEAFQYPRCLKLTGRGGELYTEQDDIAVPDLAPCEWAGPIPEPTEGRNHDKR